MFGKMKEVYEMQKKAREIQKKLESVVVEKTDNGITVKVNGVFKVQEISIDSALLSADKKEKLESALAKTLSQALSELQKRSALESQELLKGFSF